METKVKRVETRDEAITRLAALAEARGIRVFVYPATGEHYATSASSPGLLHRVTLWTCDCEGFIRTNRCTHHSALLRALGELPPTEPAAVVPVDLPAVVEARAELARLEDLWENHKLKSCDIRTLQAARAKLAELTMPADLVAIGA